VSAEGRWHDHHGNCKKKTMMILIIEWKRDEEEETNERKRLKMMKQWELMACLCLWSQCVSHDGRRGGKEKEMRLRHKTHV